MYRTANMQGIGGVGMWALSYDGSRQELWGALRDHFTDCATIACQDTFFDMGGTHGSYFNRENWTWTLAPTGASQVTVTFHSFQLENGYDTLWIYNGPSTASPLIGYYTGSASPGVVTGTSGSLTFRYKSDNATVAPGWLATWTCVLDNTPPTTAISPLATWYGRNFSATFTDSDNQAVAQGYVCVADYNGSRWGAATAKGFAYEDFPGTALPPGWTTSVGTWSVANGYLTQSDETQTNTNLYFPLTQDATTEWLYHWKMRLGGSGTNRRAGLHIFASDPTQSQRGDSYLLWFRLDNQRIEIYRITGNTLPSPQYQQSYAFSANTWYDLKATYNPTTGLIRIWINDQLVGSWTDPAPLTGGGYLSLRTGNARVDYDELRVYRSRGNSFLVEVGVGGHARYEGQPAVRLLSLVRDVAHLWSATAQAEAGIDWTPPTTTLSVSGWKTADFAQSFTDSDALSGVGYRFFLPLFYSSGAWQAQPSAGVLFDDFVSALGSWSAGAGTWSVSSGFLVQSDATSANTGYHHAVAQGAFALYRVRARLTNTTGNRRWGFHILADDISLAQRGNSYLIWLRYDQQDLQIYETISNTLYARRTVPLSLSANTDYLVEVLYANGYIAVWVNGSFIASWTDDTPLSGGTHISLRTNQAEVQWDFVEVWRARSGTTETISVGASAMLAAQNSSPAQPGGRLRTLVLDAAENFSATAQADVNVDWTPPTAPAAVRDGLAADESVTHDGGQLSANWDASSDPHSGVISYEYAIGTSVGATDVVGWTDLGAALLTHTHAGLSLVDGQRYYFGVRAKNVAGLLGPATWSDGITYVADPLTYRPPIPHPAAADLAAPRLYPIPAQDWIWIELPEGPAAETAYLLDAVGRVLLQVPVAESRFGLSVASLARGVYWVWVPPYAPMRLLRE